MQLGQLLPTGTEPGADDMQRPRDGEDRFEDDEHESLDKLQPMVGHRLRRLVEV